MADVMVSVRLTQEENNYIQKIVAKTQKSRSFFIRQALDEKLEDIYSYYLGEEALQEWIADNEKEYTVSDLETMIANGFPADV
jgi:RHH-type rel operon transcriptional repressor/antitoxin RelB